MRRYPYYGPPPYDGYPDEVYGYPRRRVPGCVWLFLLGLIAMTLIIVFLYPYRFLILHIVTWIGITLGAILAILLLIGIAKVVLRIVGAIRSWHARREDARIARTARVHDALPGGYVPRYPAQQLPPIGSRATGLLLPYDYDNKRPPEHLNPGQRGRF